MLKKIGDSSLTVSVISLKSDQVDLTFRRLTLKCKIKEKNKNFLPQTT